LVAAYTLKYIGVEEDPDDSAYRLLEQVLQKTSKQKPNSNWFDAYRYQLLTILGYIDSTEKPKDRETLRLLIQQAEYSANIDSQ
jgi:recombinational DNA repair protein (RecF pathway)